MLFRIHNNELSRSGSRPQNIINCFIGRTFPNILSITPIFKSLHLLKVNERIEYKLFSLTCKVLTAAQPSYLHNLITLQPPRSTRSSSVVTLSLPPTISSLKITDRSFRCASPRLWNQLPDSFRQPHQSCLDSPPHPQGGV